jgi:hypothetical protein
VATASVELRHAESDKHLQFVWHPLNEVKKGRTTDHFFSLMLPAQYPKQLSVLPNLFDCLPVDVHKKGQLLF